MTGYTGTALRAALVKFEELLQVEKVAQSRVLGRTQTTTSAAQGFYGVIAPAGEWKQMIAPGGVMSATQPVLVVDSDLVSAPGASLTIDKDDIIIRADGQRLKVVERMDEGVRFGVILYTLTEDRS